MTDTFEEYLRHMPNAAERMPVIYVADNCFLAKCWFEARGISYTAADILRFAELVAQRERDAQAGES